MSKKALEPNILRQFTGSGNWYRHALVRSISFTDGAKYVADEAEAHWLLDEIALAQVGNVGVKKEEFQHWKLVVDGAKADLRCEDGNGNVIFEKMIGFTDFPEPGIDLFYCNQVIHLPSEY